MNYLVRDREVIFNLAGQVSHIDSMRDPHTDLEINCRSQLTILEACRQHNPTTKVVFAGTRQIYGRPDRLPVDEIAPRAPDRHQRHQQGGRRVLPPRLQQRLRRARLLAAADQRLRPAPADPAQPAGLHRLVHPAGARGQARSRSTATARRCATSCTSTTCRDAFLRAGASDACNGDVVQRRRRRADRASRPGDAPARRRPDADRATFVRVARREAPDRHRIVLLGLHEVHARRPAGRRRSICARASAARSRSTASTSTSTSTPPTEPHVMTPARAVHVARARARCARPCAKPSTA